MKQLLSLALALFPCLAMAQYPGNGNQKITLGEQTSADGLVYRGNAADTVAATLKITKTNKSDTSAFLLLDTINNVFLKYNIGTTYWTRLNILPTDTASMLGNYWRSGRFSGVLPVANGGTGASSFSPNNYLIRTNSSGIFDTSAIYEANGRVGIGTATPSAQLNFVGDYTFAGLQPFEMSRSGVSRNDARFLISNGTNTAGQFLPFFQGISNDVLSGLAVGFILQGAPEEDNSSNDVGIRLDGRRKDNTSMTTGAIVEFTNRNAPVMRIMGSGNLGIGQTTPTAVLHLKSGTATASTAPLKFTSGTNLTTAEAGAMEFNGTNLFFSPSTTRHTVNHGLTGSATLDFLSTNAQNSRDMTIAVTGAADGDIVSLGVPNAAVNANTSYSAWVSAANTVTVRFNNYSSGTVDPASGLFKVFITK